MRFDTRPVFLATALLLGACDGGGDDTGGDDTADDTGGDDTADTDSGDTDTTGTLITAAAGGTVTSPDGKMTLDIPAGALAADTRITIDIVPQASWASIVTYTDPITAVYDLGPDGTTFSTPAIATFDIDAASVDLLWTVIEHPFDPAFEGWAVPSAFVYDGDGDPDDLEVTTTLEADGTATSVVEVPHFSEVYVGVTTLNGVPRYHVTVGDPYERKVGEKWASQLAIRHPDTQVVTYRISWSYSGSIGFLSGGNSILTGSAFGVIRARARNACFQEGTGHITWFIIPSVPDPNSPYGNLLIDGPEVTCVAPPIACTPQRQYSPTGWAILHVTDAGADAAQSTLESFNGCQAVVTESAPTLSQILIDGFGGGERRTDNYVVVSADGEGPGTGDSYDAVLSGYGQRGVFLTQADDLLGQTTGTEAALLFSVSETTGLPTLERFARTPATHRESYPAISGDGRWVAFNDHTSNTWILDAETPASTAKQLPSGLYPVVDKWGGNVAVSYYYNDGNLFPYQIYVIDLDEDRDGETVIEAGTSSFDTERRITRSVAGADYCNGTSAHTRTLGLSDTGRFVLYSSDATNLTSDSVTAVPHIFLHDRDADEDWVFDEADAGATTTEIVSRLPNGDIAASPSVVGQRWLSDDARYAVFQTYDLTSTTGIKSQVYVRDLVAGTTALVTATSGGAPANGNSFSPFIAPDGKTIALVTTATDLPGVPAPSPSVAVVGPNPLWVAP